MSENTLDQEYEEFIKQMEGLPKTLNRKKALRLLKESIPKHMDSIQEILVKITVEYADGNESAKATSKLSYMILRQMLELESGIELMRDMI